jgi:MFS family permease
VGRGRIALYVIAHAAIWAAALAPVLVALPIRVEELAPDDTSQALSLILAAGGIVALASPGLGWLSDRTRRRTGSRRPWLLGGMLIACAASVLLATAESIAQLVLGWCVAQIGLNFVIVTLMAVLVDTVPPRRRGVVAGLLGVGPPIGAVTGTWLLDAVSDSQALLFIAPTALAAVAVGAFALVLPSVSPGGDGHATASATPRGDLRALTWAWLSRLAFFFGVVIIGNYQALFLIDDLGRSPDEVPQLMAIATLMNTTFVIAASLITGRASDRIRRRKPFLLVAGFTFALGATVLVSADSFVLFVVAVSITGLALGTYAAVDLALITDLLRSRERAAAKDLGVFKLANGLPQVLAPALASVALVNGYPALFAAAAACGILAALSIVRVRGVA